MTDSILEAIGVVELGSGHAVAVAAMLLAEAGADVVKVEDPKDRDCRSSAAFAVWNRSKQSAVIDARSKTGREEIYALLSRADVLITDWTPEEQAEAGFDSQTLRRKFPALIHTSVGGWPAGHSLENRPVDDTLVLAEAGILDEQRGYREGPIYLRFPLGSWGAAYLAAIGTLAKLIQRDRGGTGGVVQTSLVQGALVPTAMLWRRAEHSSPAIEQSMGKSMRSPQFECADGVWLHVKAPPDTAPLMREALDALGEARVAELNHGYPSDHTCINWGANAHIFRTRPSDEWLKDLWGAGIPVQADVPMGQVYFDEQARINDYVVTVDDPVFGRTSQPGPPVTVEPPMAVRGPAPVKGSTVASEWREGLHAPKPCGGVSDGLPLSGIRVADFGAYLAGPLAAMLLADLGADVIKIEGTNGDIMRRVPGAFFGCQRGKRSLALDLKDEGAGPVTRRIAEWADVVHHNIRLPAAQRLGLDYPSLRSINPELIFCHVSSYGPRGPRKDWPGYDQLFQAQTGWEYEGAGEGNQPMWHRFGMMDHQAAMASVFGTLLALYHRDRTGKGQAVAASLLGASLLTVSETIVGPDGKLTPFPRLDTAQTGISESRRLYEATDGWVAVVADRPGAMRALRSELGVDADASLKNRLGTMTCAAIVSAAQRSGARAAIAHTDWRDTFFDDLDNRAARLVTDYAHSTLGKLEMVGAYLAFEGRAAINEYPPPEIGEHSTDILSDLGFETDTIAQLLDSGVVKEFGRETKCKPDKAMV